MRRATKTFVWVIPLPAVHSPGSLSVCGNFAKRDNAAANCTWARTLSGCGFISNWCHLGSFVSLIPAKQFTHLFCVVFAEIRCAKTDTYVAAQRVLRERVRRGRRRRCSSGHHPTVASSALPQFAFGFVAATDTEVSW